MSTRTLLIWMCGLEPTWRWLICWRQRSRWAPLRTTMSTIACCSCDNGTRGKSKDSPRPRLLACWRLRNVTLTPARVSCVRKHSDWVCLATCARRASARITHCRRISFEPIKWVKVAGSSACSVRRISSDVVIYSSTRSVCIWEKPLAVTFVIEVLPSLASWKHIYALTTRHMWPNHSYVNSVANPSNKRSRWAPMWRRCIRKFAHSSALCAQRISSRIATSRTTSRRI